MSSKAERAETARFRFYMFGTPNRADKYPYQIHDAGASPKVMAKFKDPIDAQLFLEIRRNRYVKTGE